MLRWLAPFSWIRWRCLGTMPRECGGCRCRKLPAFHGSENKLIRCSDSRFILTTLLHINCNVTAYITFMYFGLMNACFFGLRMLVWLFFLLDVLLVFRGIMTGWMNSCFSVEISFLIASVVAVSMIFFCLHRYDGWYRRCNPISCLSSLYGYWQNMLHPIVNPTYTRAQF